MPANSVQESASAGNDEVRTALTAFTLTAANVEILRGISNGGQALTGGAAAGLTIIGGTGNDTLDDGGAAAILQGGLGDDIYIVRAAGTTVVENAGEGTDTVRAHAESYTLGTNLENLHGMLATGQTLTGNSASNVIQGGAGNDVLASGGGNDTLHGNDGDDRFLISRVGGTAMAVGGSGTNTLVVDFGTTTSAVTAAPPMGPHLVGPNGSFFDGVSTGVYYGGISRIEITTGSQNDNIATTDGDDNVVLNGGDDFLSSGRGNDVADGGEGIDGVTADLSQATGAIVWNLQTNSYSGSIGAFTNFEYFGWLSTGSGNDLIVTAGGGRKEIVNLGSGDDSVAVVDGVDQVGGGAGIDTLVVDYSSATVHVRSSIYSQTGGGFLGDISAGEDREVSFIDVERFVVTGGSAGDYLQGGDGDDILDGRGGADMLMGWLGNDVYVVDSGDQVSEGGNQGVDEIRTALGSYVLGANLENLTATSYRETPLLLRGNALDNVIATEVGAAVISLQDGGADVAYGATNDDTFYFGAAFGAGDRVDGGTGTDRVVLQGAYGPLTLIAGTMEGIQTLALLSAGDDRFGGSAAGSYSYDIAVAADFSTAIRAGLPIINEGGELLVDASGLVAGESLNFDGSAADPALGSLSVKGGAGADHLIGSAGGDDLSGGGGDDVLEGGGGGDYLSDDGGDFTVLRGGEGDDTLVYSGVSRSALTVEGGNGDDWAWFATDSAGAATFDMGDGDDRVEIRFMTGGMAEVTLGAGQDVLTVSGEAIWQAGFRMGTIVVADFDAGPDGDRFEWPADLAAALSGWTPGSNPFAAGYARLVQDGADTLLQISQLGNGDFSTLVRFEDAAPAEFTGENFGGWSPLPVTGGSGADQLVGTASSDYMFGEGGNDVFRLQSGGDDIVHGGDGLDTFFFIGALTAADVVEGGAGVDTVVVQGPYGSLTLTANITQIENVSILGGNNTNFGEPGTNRYDYVLTTSNANFAAGVQARINGAALLEGEDFTFDGSAETDASYVVYGGKGRDTLLGGLGNDIFFYAEERFASGDTVNGGAGYDGMFLRGNYTIDFNAPGYTGLFTNIENLTLTSATDERYARGGGTEFDYDLILSDAIVNAGQTLTVSGALLMASETMILDASQETDGAVRLFGGASNDILKGGALADYIHGNLGADTLSGGGGADTFRYQSVLESNGSSIDRILDFTPGTDKIELDRIDARTNVAGDQAFTWIGSNAFSGSAGQLRAYEQSGTWFVEGDVNGDGAADLVIALTLQGPTPLGAGDFLL